MSPRKKLALALLSNQPRMVAAALRRGRLGNAAASVLTALRLVLLLLTGCYVEPTPVEDFATERATLRLKARTRRAA